MGTTLNFLLNGPLKNRHQIEITAPQEVWGALKDLGRTEDVKLSPSNRRLAIAGFAKSKLLVLDVDIVASADGKRVILTDFMEITSPSLLRPHGLFFIDEETLVVANRRAGASILRLPASGAVAKKIALPALQTISDDQFHRLKSPGSVSVSRIDQDLYEVLICNNYENYVTRHILKGGESFVLKSNEIFLSKGLSTPDGVAVNKESRWIAISNHDTHSVLLYENRPQLNEDSEAVGILRNVNYPHGVRFTPDDNFVLVADAGSPFLNIYAKDGDSWSGTRDPVTTFRVMDEMIYRRGRKNPQEGGPKGIDIDNDMSVLVTTCEQQVLAFFDLAEILKKREIPMDWHKQKILWLMERYVLWRMRKIKANLQRLLE